MSLDLLDPETRALLELAVAIARGAEDRARHRLPAVPECAGFGTLGGGAALAIGAHGRLAARAHRICCLAPERQPCGHTRRGRLGLSAGPRMAGARRSRVPTGLWKEPRAAGRERIGS